MRLLAAASVAVIIGSGSALAQGSLQKCVDPDGKVTYTDGICAGGAKVARQIHRDARRPDADSVARVQAEQELADRYRRTRLETEAAESKAGREAALNAELARARAAASTPREPVGYWLGGVYVPPSTIVINNAPPAHPGSGAKPAPAPAPTATGSKPAK